MNDDKFKEGIAAMVEHYEKQIEDLRFSLKLARSVEKDLREALEGPKQDRRRRIFEQVAIQYTSKHWPDYSEQPSDTVVLGWAAHTAEMILSAADEFAEKETKE